VGGRTVNVRAQTADSTIILARYGFRMTSYEVGVVLDAVRVGQPAEQLSRHALRLSLSGPMAMCGAGAAYRLPGRFEPADPSVCVACLVMVGENSRTSATA
jgi:hypothetical protein